MMKVPFPKPMADYPEKGQSTFTEEDVRRYAEAKVAEERERIATWLEGQGQPGYAHEVRHRP